MNVTKNVICDLFPLYVANECSVDSRDLVDEYLRKNPGLADELRRIVNTPVPTLATPAGAPDEVRSLCEARRRVRNQSLLMGLAIFFSLVPFSFLATGERTYWLLFEYPRTALIYGAIGIGCWVAYAIRRRNSKSL